MKSSKKIPLLLSLLLISGVGFSQNTTSDSTATKNTTTPSSSSSKKSSRNKFSFKDGWSIGLDAYQIAPGMAITKVLVEDRLNVRFGFNTSAFVIPSASLSSFVPDSTIGVGGSFSIGRGYIAVDYQVKGIFGLTGGFQYNDFGAQMVFAKTSDLVFEEKLIENGVSVDATITVPKELIGNIRMNIESAKYAPFVGLALGRSVPKRRWGFRFETGVVFQGALKASLVEKQIDTGYLDDNGDKIIFEIGENAASSAQTDDLNKELSDAVTELNDLLGAYPFMPYLNFTLIYRIK